MQVEGGEEGIRDHPSTRMKALGGKTAGLKRDGQRLE
jgi:hypothetical protein